MSEESIRNYLASVQERDVDILLMEEFYVSESFVAWFSAQLGFQTARSVGAWHSVSNSDGETDLVLIVIVDEDRIGILIENKISANEQDEQDIRYHKRGRTMVKEGKVDAYRTVMCAPSNYLSSLPENSQYQHFVCYEEIATWYAQFDDPRSNWRHSIMCHAIEQRRRGSTMVVNQKTTNFHSDFWQHLRSNHPSLHMNKPGPKGSKSSWIIIKKDGFPKNVKIHFKFDQQVVELGFRNHTLKDLERLSPELSNDIFVGQKGKVAVLGIAIPHIDVSKAVGAQIDELETAISSAFKLAPYATVLNK